MFSNILGGAAGFPVADLGDEISQSLRFRAGQNLRRTFGTPTNRNIWTFSLWLKRGDITRRQDFFTASNDGLSNGTLLEIFFGGSDQFTVGKASTTNSTTARFRDPSAWYHLVVVNDGTDIEQYVNNALVSTWSGQGGSTGMNNDKEHSLGSNNYNNQNFNLFDGYMAQVLFVDGQALAPTDFGKDQEDGVWVPQNYTGTYGNNGFHLDFADSSDPGNDVSGNNNDFTATGFDTSAISSSNFDNDVDYLDTPTSNYPTINPLYPSTDPPEQDNTEEANLGYTGKANRFGTGATTMALPSSGEYYWEHEVVTHADHQYFGVTRMPSVASGSVTGWISFRAYDGANWYVYQDSTLLTTGNAQITDGDVISQAYNVDTGVYRVWINGTLAATNTWTLRPTDEELYIFGSLEAKNSNEFRVNYGQRDFIYDPPTGAKRLQTNNLPEPTIKNGKDHFDVVTYTGNTSSPPTVTGLNFQPDLVWIKIRSVASNHSVYDSIRGATAHISPSSNSEQITDGSVTITSDGFTVGAENTELGSTNSNNNTYVAWCWKAGGSTTQTNNDGTRTSSVSANTDAGFSMVSFDGTDGDTIGHGLSERPEFILDRDLDGEQHWRVFHYMMDDGDVNWDVSDNLHLDLTDEYPAARGAATRIDQVRDAFFRIAGGTNGNARIAYCWHSVEGFSKFGSYEGNNDSDGTFVYLGFKPALVIFKNVDAVGSWVMYDSTLNSDNPVDTRLTANSDSSTGTSSSMHVDFLSNGFKHRNSDQDLNTNHTFIYMAWAENPFGGENAAPATAR